MSNIRLSVDWDKTAVYAGERINCTITFKNIARAPISQRAAGQTSGHNSRHERWKNNTAAHVRRRDPKYSSLHYSSTSVGGEHRKASSYDAMWSTIPATSMVRTGKESHSDQNTTGRKHGRSVSIVPMNGEKSMSGNLFQTISPSERPVQGYGRAASLQIPLGKDSALDHDPSSTVRDKGSSTRIIGHRQILNDENPSKLPSLLSSSSAPRVKEESQRQTACTSDASMAGPKLKSKSKSHDRAASSHATSSARAPQSPDSLESSAERSGNCSGDDFGDGLAQTHIPRQDAPQGKSPGIIPPTSNDNTARSSTDLDSFGSNSSDTMASEYMMQEHSRFMRHPFSMRQQSPQASFEANRVPETLMMGYANIVGSFSLDPSLIDASHFDDVKRKAVIGNEGGGGVVRAESTKRQSGLLGSFGWNAIGGSLEGLLGRREVSSLKDGTTASTSKWLPILSTPQSLLFVDLRLGPGQSQSYSYSFRLPAGIPPSYRGKAVKFSYNIVIGVQRATRSRQRHVVRRIEFPFRVLPSVNVRGETTGHDLMSPHVMLQNQPLVVALDKAESGCAPSKKAMQSADPSAEVEFLSYMNQLLDASRRDSSLGLLSPSAAAAKPLQDTRNEATTMDGAIAFAIQQSNSLPSKLSANRFEITRGGLRVAVIMLARPAYRLGEVVPIVVDLQASEFQGFSIRTTLETSEHLDPTLALRSPASILRASRRIYAIDHETTLSADRVVFNLAVPSSSTPEFVTSAVSLEWRLRFEFVTSIQTDRVIAGHGATDDILEKVSEDERGSVSVAVEAMPCETFEVTLPIHVYGSVRELEENFVQNRQWYGIA
ncbi:MAG: hypothetical protein Q9204_000168 [Flavoplaca sp. TL-2023a]